MNLIYIILFSVLCFACLFLGGKKYFSTTLYALAIGGAVNSNFFNAVTYPINCFGLNFGIDCIIYTLFIFCVILMYFYYGKKDAYILTVSSLVAILFSAIMQLVASLLTQGSSADIWVDFGTFVVSCFASLAAIFVMINLFELLSLKVKNKYVFIMLGIITASLINSGIYFGLITLISGTLENFGNLLLSSLIGKSIATICAVVAFSIITIIEKKQKNKNNALN